MSSSASLKPFVITEGMGGRGRGAFAFRSPLSYLLGIPGVLFVLWLVACTVVLKTGPLSYREEKREHDKPQLPHERPVI